MQKITLYDYQVKTVKAIAASLVKHKSTICVLPTGAGKSVVIGYIANNFKGRVLILTHRVEILRQNSEWINNLGVLTSKENSISLDTRVVIAMVQTLYARIKKEGIDYIGQFDLIITDESHYDIHEKVVVMYKPKYKVGFTATPIIDKRELVVLDGIDYWRYITLSDQYNDIVVGATTAELILAGKLVEEEAYKLELPTINQLEDSNTNPDGYTTKSLNKVYSNTASLKILAEAYNSYCKGKKVLLFNPTTAMNPVVEKLFKSKGVDCRTFDSVNSDSKDRAEVINWFENKRSAMLIGTNIFTTGFNVTDIEVIIFNRSTKSLSLWLQSVGRGSRTTKKIFKDKFILLDLGQNIDRHGMWSDDIDWKSYFHSKPMEPRKKKDITVIWECPKCQCYVTLAELVCPECGTAKPKPKVVKRADKTGVIVAVEKTIFPKSNSIIEYTKQNGKGTTFAFKLIKTKLVDLFKTHNISKEYYENRRDEFLERVHKISNRLYFGIINSNLTGPNKKLSSFHKEITKAIDNHYGINT